MIGIARYESIACEWAAIIEDLQRHLASVVTVVISLKECRSAGWKRMWVWIVLIGWNFTTWVSVFEWCTHATLVLGLCRSIYPLNKRQIIHISRPPMSNALVLCAKHRLIAALIAHIEVRRRRTCADRWLILTADSLLIVIVVKLYLTIEEVGWTKLIPPWTIWTVGDFYFEMDTYKKSMNWKWAFFSLSFWALLSLIYSESTWRAVRHALHFFMIHMPMNSFGESWSEKKMYKLFVE